MHGQAKKKKNYSKAHKERDPKEREKKKHEKVQLQSPSLGCQDQV
jgi:hypothetical protein